MSATNRGSTRRPRDFYPTPRPVIRALFYRLGIGKGSLVIDPACGDGRIPYIAEAEFGARGVGWDIDKPGHYFGGTKDSLGENGWDVVGWAGFDVPFIITNPPFSHALEFVQRALNESLYRPTCMLLPLSFMASKRRSAFHQANPSKLFVLSNRPSFTDDGKTDAQDYGWFCWNIQAYAKNMGWEVMSVVDGC